MRGESARIALFSRILKTLWYIRGVGQSGPTQNKTKTVMNTSLIRQCIKTRYVGPTNTKPGRIKASAERGSIVVPWAAGLSVDENHHAACLALIAKFRAEDGYENNGWGTGTEWVGGADNGEHVWVRVVGLGAAKSCVAVLSAVAESFQAGKRGGEVMGAISNAIDSAMAAKDL